METSTDSCRLALVPNVQIAGAVVYSVLAVAGSVGNILVVLVIRRTPSLSNICGLLIANQAVADLLVTAIVNSLVVFVLAQSFFQLCLLDAPLFAANLIARFSCTASLLIVTLLSMDRCFAICSPFKHKVMITFTKAKVVLAKTWIESLVLPFLEAYLQGSSALMYLQSAGVLACYIVIFVSGIVMVRDVRANSVRVNSLHESQNQSRFVADMRERNKQVAKTIAVVVGLFSLCWIPVALVFSARLPKEKASESIWFWCATLGLANSAVNPWIYFYRQKNYRRALKALLRCHSSVVDVGAGCSSRTRHQVQQEN